MTWLAVPVNRVNTTKQERRLTKEPTWRTSRWGGLVQRDRPRCSVDESETSGRIRLEAASTETSGC